MLFNIEETEPVCSGWLVPDNPSSPTALLLVTEGGRRRREIRAQVPRPDLAGVGLHTVGHAGFRMDETVDPALVAGEPYELYELASNTLIFRRVPGADLPLRIFHLETQTHPVYALSRHLSPWIRMIYGHLEMMTHETLSSIVRVDWPSVLLSGGTFYRNYEAALRQREYIRVALLSRPEREFAAKLLRIKALAEVPANRTGWRTLGQGALMAALAEVDLTNPAALGRVLGRLDDEAAMTIANPTTRKLVANLPNLPLDKHHVGSALSSLATFDLVGFDDDLDGFVDTLEALLGLDGLSREALAGPPELDAVVDSVAECRAAHELMDLDEGVFELARTAFDKARADEDAA